MIVETLNTITEITAHLMKYAFVEIPSRREEHDLQGNEISQLRKAYPTLIL